MIPALCLCSTRVDVHGVPMIRCGCGVLRQEVQMTEKEYRDWYERRYFDGVYTHNYEQDARVADLRLDTYQLVPGQRLLDIGCGNGAFVERANARGIDASGQDLALQAKGPRIYIGALIDIEFQTASFDVVTMHDVLEHVPEPLGMLKEVRRLLKSGGRLIVDFPRFFHPAGVHHWKTIEHLWMLDERQLQRLLESVGFRIDRTYNPIPSKYVVSAIRV
jgi:2-polyprenyl-3-methyl-5-hydroxy-6-metoxy-1,4-benzoquinol methylase